FFFPTMYVLFLIVSARLTSKRTEEYNFNARPPGVVSGFPNITPTFSRIWLINIAIVFDLLIAPDSFLNACDIKRACKPTCDAPISPSISALGTNAQQSRLQSYQLHHFVQELQRFLKLVLPYQAEIIVVHLY